MRGEKRRRRLEKYKWVGSFCPASAFTDVSWVLPGLGTKGQRRGCRIDSRTKSHPTSSNTNTTPSTGKGKGSLSRACLSLNSPIPSIKCKMGKRTIDNVAVQLALDINIRLSIVKVVGTTILVKVLVLTISALYFPFQASLEPGNLGLGSVCSKTHIPLLRLLNLSLVSCHGTRVLWESGHCCDHERTLC